MLAPEPLAARGPRFNECVAPRRVATRRREQSHREHSVIMEKGRAARVRDDGGHHGRLGPG